MRTQFPTRQIVPTLGSRSSRLAGVAGDLQADGPVPTLMRFLKGLDASARAMTDAEVSALGDVFTQRILLAGQKPLTLRGVADAIAALGAPPLPLRKMFLIAEGAQAAAAGAPFALNDRIVFTWQASEQTPADILLSTVAAPDDPAALLQLIAWSEQDRAFHYFERKDGAWVWAGNSFHALAAPTRGQGPFDSHINGGLVMKELKVPWTHWHSMSSSIDRTVFGAASAFNTDPLFAQLEGAEVLENIVRTGVNRWTKGRFARDLRSGVLERLPEYLRQVLWCTSFNLASSRDAVANPQDPEFTLPTSTFFDAEAIEFLAIAMDPTADIIPARQIAVDAALYREVLATRGVVVRDESNPPNTKAGDTQFAFLAPERAFEDLVIVMELVNRGVLSPRLGLCLTLVDFSNPVFSPARAALLRHVPDQVAAGGDGAALDQAFIAAVSAASAPAGSPEQALLDLWSQPDLLGFAADALGAFRAAVQARLATAQGVSDLVDLANSRRDIVRQTRSLAEFHSTMPRAPAAPLHLAMRPDGSVFVKTSHEGEGEL